MQYFDLSHKVHKERAEAAEAKPEQAAAGSTQRPAEPAAGTPQPGRPAASLSRGAERN